jgi:GMP synthase-like glutamine amidotransferase
MNVLIIKHVDNEGPGLIEPWLKEEKIRYRVLNLQWESFFPRIDDWSHVVLLGGPMNVYEEDRYPFLKKEDLFIKEAVQRGRTLLGICLGAQLIAKALGARVTKAPAKEIGWYDVALTEEGLTLPVFSQFPPRVPVFQWHEDTFDIPKFGKLVATASSVPNQAFCYGKNTYGLQFHLEVTEAMIREWLEADQDELSRSLFPHFSKEEILEETGKKIDDYTERGRRFLKAFFRTGGPG